MKRSTCTYVLLGLLLLAACKKWDPHGPLPPGINEKYYLLKKVIHGTRAYTFYFNKKKVLDSIVEEDVKDKIVYRIFRSNNRLDSVVHFRNGRPWFRHYYIQYDSTGHLIYYLSDYIPTGNMPMPTSTRLTYDQGELRSTTTIPPWPSATYRIDSMYYNGQKDIVRWVSNFPRTVDLDVKRYTYDNKYNPLYFIDDLWVIMSESYIGPEFFLSQHNSTSKYSEYFNVNVTYQNSYDNRQRLTKKVFTERFAEQPDSLVFEYQH
jgi:hypothetical protein